MMEDHSKSSSHVINMGKLREYEEVVEDMREVFLTGRTKNVKYRLKQLNNLLKLYRENWKRFRDVLHGDLKKPSGETKIFEHSTLIGDVKFAIKNLKKWTKAQVLPTCVGSVTDKSWYRYEPFGTVLIISAWNYPLLLAFAPLCAAIAAGNCAVIKTSEMSPQSAALVAELVPKYLDNNCYRVVTGGPEVCQGLLEEKWDFIFYTGSTTVGKIIHQAAARSLTPVCLELGGKSPVYIDPSADMKKTAQRVIWGKLANFGQTCISPDYVLCSKQVEDIFIPECRQALKDFYGPYPQESVDLGRIVNLRHFHRLCKYISDARDRIAVGGNYDESDLWIEPTIITGVDPDEEIMTEEIFGPILPICRVQSADEAVKFINERPRSLSLYVFAGDKKVSQKFIDGTHSGNMAVNDCLHQTALPDMPFGGVGDSGMGQYHGVFGFQTFSRPRSVCERSFSAIENWTVYRMRHPPYSNFNIGWMGWVLERFDLFFVSPMKYFPYLIMFLLGLLVMYGHLKEWSVENINWL